MRPGPFGPSACREEHLVQPRFGAAALLHVPWAEGPVLLSGPAQRSKVGQDGDKLRIAEVRQRQERPSPAQVVMGDNLGSSARTLTRSRCPIPRSTSSEHAESTAIGPGETSVAAWRVRGAEGAVIGAGSPSGRTACSQEVCGSGLAWDTARTYVPAFTG